MRYALMTEPQQGYSYQDILDAAISAKAAGFDTFFRSDHYSSFPGEEGLPATDCWTTLAGLARDTEGIGLGSMVSPVTFRIPGSYAKVVATVIEMAGERTIEMGIGAGWNKGEHAALFVDTPRQEGQGGNAEQALVEINDDQVNDDTADNGNDILLYRRGLRFLPRTIALVDQHNLQHSP